ncbi:hypothetical protein BGZ76_005981 [Entomortierella beljakovae]|nr:hypothetical protein BGZ76_005981 [Entomortierella beljakovae]
MSATNDKEAAALKMPPSSFAPGNMPSKHTTSIAEASGLEPSPTLPTPSSAASSKAAMHARRKSRGMSEGLRPDFVFPKRQPSASELKETIGNGLPKNAPTPKDNELSSTTIITLNSIDSNGTTTITSENTSTQVFAEGGSKRLSVSLTNGSLPIPSSQSHLKTHYRTHSRNGSTVTVQDLKQAIAAVSRDILDLPPITKLSTKTEISAELEPSGEPGSASIATGNTTSVVSSTIVTSDNSEPPKESILSPDLLSTQGSEPKKSLGLQLNPIKHSSTFDSTSAPTTPIRDSYAVPPLSPSPISRPSSMILNRTARDRSNATVPPFFSYSIPHEFPSPYTSPRLLLPGAAGPTTLPFSPFARKRKHVYHQSIHSYPSSTIDIKLPGQNQKVTYSHGFPVKDVSDIELIEQENVYDSINQEETIDTDALAELPSTSAADKRMSWASMVTLDEDNSSKVSKVVPPATSQPYRPPGSRMKSGSDASLASNAPRSSLRKLSSADSQPVRRTSPTPEKGSNMPVTTLEPAAEIPDSKAPSTGRGRKSLPPRLNLSGNTNLEENNSSAPGSPTTPTTPGGRRRRSRSRKNNKDKSLDGTQQNETEKQSEKQAGDVSADQPKKTRSRSRSKSRSRNRSHGDNGSSQGSSNESVPPVPQTPSWVPTHNVILSGPLPASDAATTVAEINATNTTSTIADTATVTTAATTSSLPATVSAPGSVNSESVATQSGLVDPPMSPISTSNATMESELKRRGPRPARLLSTRSSNNLKTLNESGQVKFSPRTNGSNDYFSMRPLQHPPKTPMTPMTPGFEYGEEEDDYYGRLQMVTTPMIQNGFFPNWAKGDAQLQELENIRLFLSERQYPDEMPLSDEWTLFFSDTSRAKDKTGVHDAYSSAITPLFSCHTVPQFATSWKYVRERVRPATMKVNQNLHWFKKGIKPMWEDPRNKYGGRLTLCPPRALLDIVWETVLILMAGDVLDLNGEGTGAVFARRARGDRIEVWLGSDDTPEALAHIRGVLTQELAPSGADDLVKAAKYKKHFDSRKEEKDRNKSGQSNKEAASSTSGEPATAGSTHSRVSSSNGHGSSSSLNPSTPRLSEFQTFEAFTQHQQQQQLLREREREKEREKERERIMQLGKERFEKEKAERDRLRDEKVRAMAAAAMAASEAKHQQQLKEQRERMAAAAATGRE